MKHRHEELDNDKRIIPDGGVVRVSILTMDSTQQQISSLDERVQHNIEANQATLERMRRDTEKVQAWADHFSEQKQRDESAYGQYCQRLSNGWRQVAA